MILVEDKLTMESFGEFVNMHSLKGKDLFFTMNALVGELGELANVVKKEDYAEIWPKYKEKCEKEIKQGVRNTFQDQFIDEAGDTLFFLIQALNKKGVTLREVMEGQIRKLNEQSIEAESTFKK